MMQRMRTLLCAALLLSTACWRNPDHAPVLVGATADPVSRAAGEAIARKLEAAGCRAERRFAVGDSTALDAAIVAENVDVYAESAGAAVAVLKLPADTHPSMRESLLRTAYVKRRQGEVVWGVPVGEGDFYVVYRKPVDDKCRGATRTIMAMGYALGGARQRLSR
jgi:glycine betaine/choline ABC-type transport system substrate-binding protein